MSTLILVFSVQSFKPSGKFYTEDFEKIPMEIYSEETPYIAYMPDAIKWVRSNERYINLLKQGFYLLVNHSLGYPCLVTPESLNQQEQEVQEEE